MRPKRAQPPARRRRGDTRSTKPFDLKDIGFTLVSDEATMAEVDALHVKMIRAAMNRRHLVFV